MSIGSQIKDLRKKYGLTQVQLSKKANISRSYLADIERDRYNPSVDTLKSISAALGTSINLLFDIEPKQENTKDYFFEQYLNSLGYELIFTEEGDAILHTPDLQIELDYGDLAELKNSAESYIKFKILELINKHEISASYKVAESLDEYTIAAHNDNLDPKVARKTIDKAREIFKQMDNE